MTLTRNLAALLGIGALALSATAQAQHDNCISPAELDSMLRYSLADVIDGAATACRPTLGAAAFLASDGPALIQRYRVVQPDAWPVARHGLLKVTGADGEKDKMAGMMSKLPDEALKPFVSGLIKQMVSGGQTQGLCDGRSGRAPAGALARRKHGRAADADRAAHGQADCGQEITSAVVPD